MTAPARSPAPNNTHVTFTTVDNGATSTPNPPTACDTTAGSCTTTITSSTTGTSTVTAHTTVNVAGIDLTRATDSTHGSSAPAVKTWVNAIISISPNAFNEVNDPHTFVATIQKDLGNGTFVPAANEAVTVTLTPDSTACPSPTGPFTGTTNASGEFSVTFTSACAGTITAHASSTLAVGASAPFTIQTDSLGGNSPDATKVFQDAKISITPNGSNAVGSDHTFTATVMVDLGQGGGFVLAPDGTPVTFTSVDSNGATSSPAPPVGCVTTGGSCTTAITSPTSGTTVVSAHVTFTTPAPGNIEITRHTDGTHGSSGPATKIWRDAFIQITPQDAINPVGTTHVLTITVTATNGGVLASGTATASIVSPPSTTGSFVGSPSCNYTGGAATASCTVTITSAATGLTSVHATSTIGFDNALGTVTRATSTAGNVTPWLHRQLRRRDQALG